MGKKPTPTVQEDMQPSLKFFGSSKILAILKKILRPLSKHSDTFVSEPFQASLEALQDSNSHMSHEEKHIFNNFLQFGNKTVARVMIPRSDICAVDVSATFDDVKQIILEHVHTRTLVYNDNLDNIVGFLHIKDLFLLLSNGQKFNIYQIMRKPIMVAPSMKLVDLLAEMQKQRTHIAIILDEYGGTNGIVTIEDIIEEIVGQIEDEHDTHTSSQEMLSFIDSNTILANARVAIEDVEKMLKRALRHHGDEVETIGGLVLARAGYMPVVGDVVQLLDDVQVEVVEANPRSLLVVKISVQ